MGGNAVLFQHLENEVGAAVVDYSLTGNLTFFKSVESSGVVLVRHKHNVGIVGCEYFFCFSFVKLLAFFHFYISSDKLIFEFITSCAALARYSLSAVLSFSSPIASI